jgi:hypothetical protein
LIQARAVQDAVAGRVEHGVDKCLVLSMSRSRIGIWYCTVQ